MALLLNSRPMSSLGGLHLSNTSQYTPVTGISPVKGTRFVLSGSATRLELASLNSDQLESSLSTRRWNVLERERIHKIVSDPSEVGRQRRAVVLGGKEAILVQLSLDGDDPGTAELETLCRFSLDDFAGDAAFLSDDRILISTLHNSILIFSRPSPFSHSTASPPPLLEPCAVLHAPARPLLWTSRFSQARYESRTEGTKVRVAGGSLLGEVLVWDVDIEAAAGKTVSRADMRADRVGGDLRRLSGHRGAIFTVAFSPSSPDLLASGSDDRTLRIWDLSRFAQPTRAADSQSIGETDADIGARVLWGHEGRVWRVEWVDEARLVSVAEDATCRFWQLDFRAPSNADPSTSLLASRSPTLLKTWRDGHDGRTIWSVAVSRLPGSDGTEIALTGGADGAIRSWPIPQTLSLDSDDTLSKPSQTKKLRQGSQIKSFVVAVDPSCDEPIALSLTNDGSFYLANPSSSPQSLSPFHSSSSFASTATSLHLHFDSAVDGRATFHAFTNRGTRLFARLVLSPRSTDSKGDPPGFKVEELSEHDFGVKAVSCHFDETRTRLAIWERASWTVRLFSLPPAATCAPVPISTIAVPSSLNGTTAPTSFLFLDDSLLLVGNAQGQLSLHSIEPSPLLSTDSTLLSAVKVHSGGIADLRILRRSGSAEDKVEWEIESVGRDGMRKVTKLSKDGETWKMHVVDERWIAKGTVEKILVQRDETVHYLALVDTRAAVFDSLGRLLYSFDSPAKQSSSQFVETRSSGSRYYCVVQGRLTEQVYPSTSIRSIPPPIVSAGLHGREIRAVKLHRVQVEGREAVLVATAAENGVLSISQLHQDDSLRPLYMNRYLPSSLKSLTFSRSKPSTSGYKTTLYACGTRELVIAFAIEIVPTRRGISSRSDEENSIEVRVLERGMILADAEGGEVRTMDIAVFDREEEELVVAGYSNGKLRLWRHSINKFELVGETEGLGKCVLTVEVAKVSIGGSERTLVISGQSDGRLSIRDLTAHLDTKSPSIHLPESFFVSSPHQSGINGLTVSCKGPAIVVGTAGDDNAIAVQRIELREVGGQLSASSSTLSLLPDAHASTIQGLDFLSSNLLASSSVEQRLNVYSIDSTSTPPSIELVKSACLDVADCSAQDVVRIRESQEQENGKEERESWKIVIAGIGIDVVKVSRDNAEGG